MYSRFQLARKFINYYLRAANSKGHGVHSPFVFDFIVNVLNGGEKMPLQPEVVQYRKRLLADKRTITVEDFGAGSSVLPSHRRRISDIAAASPKNRRFASLLFRIARYYQCHTIVEMGTSMGSTTAYLSAATPAGRVITMEGATSIADIAEEFFLQHALNNIEMVRGSFDDTLPGVLSSLQQVDLLFVDGNHREGPTYDYFISFLEKAGSDSIFIFDDIHWSEGMERAWERIKAHPSVTLTIDLFFIGLVFFKDEFLTKQHFTVRF